MHGASPLVALGFVVLALLSVYANCALILKAIDDRKVRRDAQRRDAQIRLRMLAGTDWDDE